MRIAGVYASAFLFFIFVLQAQRRETKFFIYVQKRETVIIASPARVWDLTTPGILNDITDRLHPNRGNIKNNSLLLVTIKHNQYG